jgi:hypothetical protein
MAKSQQENSGPSAPERRQSTGCLIAFIMLLLLAVAAPFIVSEAAMVMACRDAHGGSC